MSDRIDKYEYLTGGEVLAFNQSQIIEQSIFTYSYEGKAFKNKQKRLEIKEKNDQGIKGLSNTINNFNQFEDTFQDNQLNNLIKDIL